MRGRVLHLGYPYNTFLFSPRVRFSDWTDYWWRFQYFGHLRFQAYPRFPNVPADLPAWDHAGVVLYPPVSEVVMRFLCLLPVSRSVEALLAIEILAAGIFSFGFARCLVRRGIRTSIAAAFAATALLTSYPLIAALDRANFEGVVWIVLSLALITFVLRRWWWAATFFGLAAAMKYFPAVLFALLLSKRKWRHVAYGIGVAAFFTALSCWTTGTTPIHAYHMQASQMRLLLEQELLPDLPLEIGFQHSLFSIIRQTAVACDWTPDQLRQAHTFYLLGTAVGGLLLYFLVIRTRPILNQIIALTACCVLLPAWSGDYTLLHLYVPWALLVLWILDHERLESSRLWVLLLPFAVVFTPQPYFNIGIRGFSGQVKAVALLALLIASLCVPLPDSALDSEEPTESGRLTASTEAVGAEQPDSA